MSHHLKEANMEQLNELDERSIKEVSPFAVFLDGYEIGKQVFIVGAAVDVHGKKHVLGFSRRGYRKP